MMISAKPAYEATATPPLSALPPSSAYNTMGSTAYSMGGPMNYSPQSMAAMGAAGMGAAGMGAMANMSSMMNAMAPIGK